MPVLSMSPVATGQVGVQPNTWKMTTSDNLATITAAGYFVQGTAGAFLLPNAVLETIYLYGTSAPVNVVLFASINSAGQVTLSVEASAGLGQAAVKAVSNNALPSVASVNGATVAGSVATFQDATGTVGQNPAYFRAQVASYAGGSATFAITDANVVVGDVVNATFATQANAASILTAVAGAGVINIVASANPGASSVNYMVAKPQ
jgi:hypothetical protein